jgi:hypothetical protein
MGTRGAEIAAILALPVTVLGLVGWRPWAANSEEFLRAAAQKLAKDIKKREEANRDALLRPLAYFGDRPTERQFPPRWTAWHPEQGQVGSVQTGDVDVLAEHRPLVILGSPGVGKTVLALRLACHLAALASAEGTAPLEVPVRLNLAPLTLWNSGEDRAEVSSALLEDRFNKWLLHTVVENGTSRRTARTLIERGWIVPVIDGLDEIDDVTAAGVVEALQRVGNTSGRNRFVITSRTGRYKKLAQDGVAERGGRPLWLDNAAVVILLPLRPLDVQAELERLFPADLERWESVIDRLKTADPNDALVTALCSPLRLYLAVTTYRRSNANPSDLTKVDTQAKLDSLLFRRLIPEVTPQQPRSTGRLYDPSDVERWLRTIERYLDDDVDFHVSQLWSAIAPRACRLLATLLAAVAAVLVNWLAFRLIASGGPGEIPPPSYLLGVLTASAPIFAWIGIPSDLRLDLLGLRHSPARRRLFRGLLQGWLICGVVILIRVAIEGISRHGITSLILWANLEVAAFAGAVLGIALGLDWNPPTADVRGTVRQGIVGMIVALIGCTCAGALWFGLIRADLTPWGTVLGLIVGIGVAGASPWFRYLTSGLILAAVGRARPLPVRRAVFLDWALRAGLLRQSGPEIKFRHRELQHWLHQSRTPK